MKVRAEQPSPLVLFLDIHPDHPDLDRIEAHVPRAEMIENRPFRTLLSCSVRREPHGRVIWGEG
jgi:hypothetical protein